MSNRRPQVSIIGSSEPDEAMLELAEQAGAAVARVGAAVVTGGRRGIMAAASKGCAEAGGTVIGVTPHTAMHEVNPYVHYHIPTGMGWSRNCITGIAGDVIVVVGGMAGTLSEIAYAWMYERPILALSASGGWAERLAGQALDARQDAHVEDCPTIAVLESRLQAILATAVTPSVAP